MPTKARKSASPDAKAGKQSAQKSAQSAKVRRRVDWDAVERDYRATQMTLRELGEKHGADSGAISRQAQKHGWSRDLTPAVRQATNAALIEATISSQISDSQQNLSSTVQAVAHQNTQIILGHRTGLQRITKIKETLLGHIEQAAIHLPDLADVIEMVRNPDENGVDKANDALRKVLGRTALVDDLKKLAEVDERVRKGEREAFGITSLGEDDKPKDPLADFIAALSARGSRLPTSSKGEQGE